MAHTVNFSMDPEADRDIIKWLDEQPNKSAAIRTALRAYMAEGAGLTLADVMAEIRALPSKLRVVSVSTGIEEAGGDEPEAAAANLDGLLGRLNGEDWD